MSGNRADRARRVRIDDGEELKKIERTRLKNNIIGVIIMFLVLAVGLYYRCC